MLFCTDTRGFSLKISKNHKLLVNYLGVTLNRIVKSKVVYPSPINNKLLVKILFSIVKLNLWQWKVRYISKSTLPKQNPLTYTNGENTQGAKALFIVSILMWRVES